MVFLARHEESMKARLSFAFQYTFTLIQSLSTINKPQTKFKFNLCIILLYSNLKKPQQHDMPYPSIKIKHKKATTFPPFQNKIHCQHQNPLNINKSDIFYIKKKP